MNNITRVQHTPGPWFFDTDELRDGSIPVLANGQRPGSLHVAHCLEMMKADEREANAALLAAAPQLLAACEMALAWAMFAGVIGDLEAPEASDPQVAAWAEKTRVAIGKARWNS